MCVFPSPLDAITQTHGKVVEGEFRPDGATDVTEAGEGHPQAQTGLPGAPVAAG